MEEVVGDYLESLTGLVESLSEEIRARMNVQEQDTRRLIEGLEQLGSSVRTLERQMTQLSESVAGIQAILDAELSKVSAAVSSDRDVVLGHVLETRDRLHEAELSLLDAYTRRPQAPRTEG